MVRQIVRDLIRPVVPGAIESAEVENDGRPWPARLSYATALAEIRLRHGVVVQMDLTASNERNEEPPTRDAVSANRSAGPLAIDVLGGKPAGRRCTDLGHATVCRPVSSAAL